MSLEVAYTKHSLTCFHFGSAYLLVEQSDGNSRQENGHNKNPTVLRFDVTNLEAAATELESKGVSVERQLFDWGHIGVFSDPDGNRCELKFAP
ncbi:hypothetical protein CJD38_00020 [Stenotrophobium rhamnosiphilum]|uniref:VOC domain-containing protein n=1 Tax=Stenotrophobium rhamnosiphilum TaxID=2029166 RepID=A0A2T5MJ14_9GAMM|nr:hypothetical protein CJD38_00020 [Stenotrophobium rhamnosiphilum]